MKRIAIFLYLVFTSLFGYCHENNGTTKVYTYPFRQGDAKWKGFESTKDRIMALQIPDSIKTVIPTGQLLGLCLDFPYLTDMYAFDDFQKGFEYMISEYNGFGELLKRDDIINELLKEYSKIELAISYLSKATDIEKGNYSFRCDLLVNLIRQINEKKELSTNIKDSLFAQTKRNVEVMKRHPELFGSMCQEAILAYNNDTYNSPRVSWYEGEIVYLNDGRQYQLHPRRTPANSVVISGTLITADFSYAEQISLKYNVENNYNATVVGPATKKYNCHSYAWHMSDGHASDEVWIGLKSAQDEDIYWTDGSYYSVSSSQATHVSYSNEHSAIRLSNGLYRSKWGALPLVEHASSEVPNSYGIPVGFYKKLSPSLSGPSYFCSYASYSLSYLPSGYTVSWSLSDNYYNTHNCLMSNYPSQGSCLITRDNTHDLMNDTLTANIKYNGNTVKKVKKKGIYAYAGFKGSYTSGSLSGNINSSGTFNIKTNTVTTVTSPNFYGATVTYSSSGATPSSWGFNSSSGILNFNTLNTTVPVIINVHDGCGNNYTLYAFPSGSYSINVSNGDGDITVTLVEDGDASKDFTLDEPWTMEITSATTGRVMATRSSASRSETISTAGWPKGIYVVKVTIGKEELTEKVLVN